MTDSHMRRAFTALSQITPAAAAVTSIDDLLPLVTERAAKLVGVERCSIYMREERANLFRGCAGCSKGSPLPDEFKRWVAGVPADGVTREVLETRLPVVVANARSDERMVKSTVRHWQIRSLLEAPMVVDGQVIGLLLMDDVDAQHEFSPDEVELARCFGDLAGGLISQTRTRLELQAKLGAAGRQLNALRRATAVDEKLSDLVLAGRSLTDLTTTLTELLGRPCALFLPDGRPVAAAAPEASPEASVPRLLEPAVAALPEVREALAANDGSRAFVVGPVPAAGLLHRHVVAPIMLGDELWGRLAVMEHKTRFTGGDVVAIRRAATLIALQVSSERKAAEADWNAGASLAAELLGGGSDATTARRRADRLGVRLDAERLVVAIGSRSGSEADAPDFRAVASAFEREAPELTAHVTTLEGGVAALVEVPAGVDPREFVMIERDRFEKIRLSLTGARRLIAGVSAVRSGPEGYRLAHREARQVVECVRRYSPVDGPALFTADELGVGALLLSSSDSEAMATFAEQTVGELVLENSKADLLTTLCSFFENMGSIRGSAAALEVHENTIRYRLSRIEELTGLAVMHDPDAQLRARLSLLVLLLQGRLPTGIATAPPALTAVAALPELEVVPS